MKYYYTFRNEYDVTDVGCIDAASDKDFRHKAGLANVKPLWSYLEDGYIGLQGILCTNVTKPKYRRHFEKEDALLFTGKKRAFFYFPFLVFLAVLIFVWVKIQTFGFILIILSVCDIAFILDSTKYYSLKVKPFDKKIELEKRHLFVTFWRKTIDVSDCTEIFLTQKIAGHLRGSSSGYENLFIVYAHYDDDRIAISSSFDKDIEQEFAEEISERMSLALRIDLE